MGSSLGQATQAAGAGAGAGLDLASNANLAAMPDVSFGTGQAMSGMAQPAGVGVANNLGAGAPMSVGNVGQMTDLTASTGMGGAIPTTPMGQQQADMLGKTNDFDFKKLSQNLSEGQKQSQPAGISPVNTQASGAGGGQGPMIYGAPQGVSGAMQAIQQGMGGGMPMGIMGAMNKPQGY